MDEKIKDKARFILFAFAITMLGYFIHPLIENGFDEDKSFFSQIAGSVSMFFLALSMYMSIYFKKKQKS